MNKHFLIIKFKEMKEQITLLGHESLNTNTTVETFCGKEKLPGFIPLDEVIKLAEPFVILERAFDKAIKKLEK